MSTHGLIALAILAVATALFLSKRLPIAVTALLVPVALHVTGCLPDPKVALRGFGNHAALAIAAVFVIGAALKESGVATMMARVIERVAGRSEIRLIISVMVAAAVLSSVMSNVAVVAILLPVSMALCRRAGVAPSRLLMPLSIAAMLGGTITVIGTAPNFLIDDFVRERPQLGIELGIFDFAPVGLAITATGILFMAFVGRRMLPRGDKLGRADGVELPEDVVSSFNLKGKLVVLRVVEASHVQGRTLTDLGIRARFHVDVVMIRRGQGVSLRWMAPDPEEQLQEGDRLYVQGEEADAWAMAETLLLQFGLPEEGDLEKLMGRGASVAEIALPPRSRALAQTFRELRFRQRTGLNVLTLVRGGSEVQQRVSDTPLMVGDTFVVTGTAEDMLRLKTSPDYIVLTDQSEVEDLRRAPLAIACLFAALIPPIAGWTSLAVSALGAAVFLVAANCVSRRALARAIDWNVICLIIGTLPLGIALQEHGVAAVVADAINHLGDGIGRVGIVGSLFLISAVLAVLTSNAAAAVIVAPVAAEASLASGLPLHNLLLAVGFGCSCAFLLPFAQCNILVMTPGGYSTRDFLRVGAWVSVVMAITTIALLSL